VRYYFLRRHSVVGAGSVSGMPKGGGA